MRPATARRRRVVFAVALLGAFAAVAPAAGAHARLVGSDPADGSALARAPGNVRLQFNEGISASFRRVVLLDGRGRAVAGTRVTRGRDAREIVIGVPPLGRGTYQLDWEVLAQQDGHVSGGAMAFGVRARPALAPRTAAGAAPPPPEALLRWLDFLLLAGLLGGLAMSLLIARAQTRGVSGAAVRVARRRVLTGAAWSGGLAVAFGGVILIRQAHALPATQPGGLSLPEAAGRLLAIRWGVLWSAREALLAGLVLTALLLRGRRAAGGAYAAAAAMALALVTIRALGGHAAAVRPSGTAVAADAVHLLAAALWIGGLAALALILRPAQHAAELARACRRPFAWTAAVSVVALAATGLYAAGAQVASVDALLTTFYGKTLIAKTALVLVAGALGLSSSMLLRALAHGRPERRAALSRLMLAELAAGLYVLLAAGLLTASSPPRGPEFAPSRIARPPTLVAQVGDVLVSATARPNRPGVNVFSVLAVSSRRPPPEPIERASLLVAPAGGPASAVALHELAPGRYSGGARLPRSGRWRMTVVLERGGRRLSTGFAWAVAAPAGARPVVVSARRLAPLLDRAAAALLIALAAGALTVAAWRRRPPRRRASPRRLDDRSARQGGPMTHRTIPAAAAAVAALALLAGPAAPGARGAPHLDAAVRQAQLDVIVVLRRQPALPSSHTGSRAARLAALMKALRDHADGEQRRLIALLAIRRLQGRVSRVRPFWIFNGLQVVADPDVISELAALPEVAAIRPNATVQAPSAPTSGAGPEWNVARVNAPALWDLGHRGQGIVVANMDTGVDISHPDLASRWRGGANSWYDPNGEHPGTPTDVSGHGTWTMGVMVGGDAGGTTLGVAPDARWIAVKIFNDRGIATIAGIHAGFQWLLDPDGNPATADAPNVVNDSWTMTNAGCDLTFQTDLRSLRTAGILPIFSAGNGGVLTGGSSLSPANNPEAFAVGDTDSSDLVDSASSRGPSACGQGTYPQLTAPGVGVRTTDVFGLYTTVTGSSIAAPHAAGALALLLGAAPGLDADRQAAALQHGALDLGATGPDNDYGAGRLDVLASRQWLATAPDFGVAAAPASATTQAGGSVSYGVDVAAVNGFAGDVALSVSGLSASQASWSFDRPAIAGGSGSSTLTVTTAASLVPGSYPLTITGTGGATTHTASVSLIVPAPPDFSLVATPSSRSTLAGGGVSYTISVGAAGGFSGTVALALTGLTQAQAAWSFAPGSIGGGAGASELTVTPAAALAPGSYPLTVTGTSGSLTHTAPLTLVVTAAPDFSVALAPPSATVVAGQTTAYTVTLGSIGGFAGTVALSASGLPSGASASFAPSSVRPPGTSTLTVRTIRTTTRGTFTLKVTGKSGTLTRQATATLVVRP